jgi:hypothetical protein
MSKQLRDFQLPVLEEHHFRSGVPVLGPVISWLRNAVYNVAARWGVLAVITRQNEINQRLTAHLQVLETRLQEYEVRLQEYEVRLIDQDYDLALLARTLAEVDLRQRYLAKALPLQEHAGEE